jgi:hypothetical protein
VKNITPEAGCDWAGKNDTQNQKLESSNPGRIYGSRDKPFA